MSPHQYDIYHYLNRTPGQFVSIYEIVKSVGGHRSFSNGRYWVLESLKYMEKEGLVEEKGHDTQEFRLRPQAEETTEFQQQQLGETPQSQLPAPEDTTQLLRQQLEDTAILLRKQLEDTTFLLRKQSEDTTEFLRALQRSSPGALGDTAIITIHDLETRT